MDITVTLLIALSIICVLLLIVVLVLALSRNNSKSKDLEASLNRDLVNFSKTLNENFNSLRDTTSNSFNILQDRLNKNLTDSYKTSTEYFNQINERMVKIDEAQKGLNDLSSNITSLQSVLTDKKNRGTFGEIELYSILETAFGTNNDRWAKQFSLSNGLKADAVIFGGESLGNIVVDSKFPLENYRRMYDDTLSKIEKDKAKTSFKQDVLKHIKDIKEKYIIPGETAEMAYMFLPAEAVFAEIYSNFDEIVDKSYESKVYIVSPTTLMAYITAIRSIYLGQKKDEKAKEIAQLLNELAIEFTRLKDRQETLQRDVEKIIPDFEQVFTTSNKIIKKFAKLNSGDIDD